MNSRRTPRNYRRLLVISILLAGAGLLMLSLLDWSVLTRYIPIPSHVALWLQRYARFAGALLVGIVLLARPIVRSQLAARLDGWFGVKNRSRSLLVGIIVVYVLVYSAFTSYRHYSFNSAAYDLGIQDQVVWNTSQGRLFEESIEGNNYLGDHFQPLLGLLAVLYRVSPSVYWLLFFQSVCLGLGCVPVFRLARREFHSPLAGLVFACAYCLYPAIGYINRFDFHFEVVAIPLLLAAWDALAENRSGLASLWLGLALFGKEEIGLTVAMVGAVAILATRRVRFGIIWILTGLAFSLTALFVLIPMFSGGPSDTLARYAWLGQEPAQMLQRIVFDPIYVLQGIQRVGWAYMFAQLFGPVAFLNFLDPMCLLLVAPGLAYNLLSGYNAQHSAYYQYVVPIIPGVFIGTIYGLSRLSKGAAQRFGSHLPGWKAKDYQYLGLTLVMTCAVFAFVVDNPVLDRGVVPAAWTQLPNAQAVREALPLVPDEGRVITTNQYGSHLSHRRLLDVYYVRPEDLSGIKIADAAFLNLQDTRDATPERYRKLLAAFVQEDFGVVYSTAGVVILQRNSGNKAELDRLLQELK